jgi:hypothetical protein
MNNQNKIPLSIRILKRNKDSIIPLNLCITFMFIGVSTGSDTNVIGFLSIIGFFIVYWTIYITSANKTIKTIVNEQFNFEYLQSPTRWIILFLLSPVIFLSLIGIILQIFNLH